MTRVSMVHVYGSFHTTRSFLRRSQDTLYGYPRKINKVNSTVQSIIRVVKYVIDKFDPFERLYSRAEIHEISWRLPLFHSTIFAVFQTMRNYDS